MEPARGDEAESELPAGGGEHREQVEVQETQPSLTTKIWNAVICISHMFTVLRFLRCCFVMIIILFAVVSGGYSSFPADADAEDIIEYAETEVIQAVEYYEEDISSTSTMYPQQHIHKPVYDEEHKPLYPLDNQDYLGFACAVVGLMVAAGGGIGGGGILVPIYILIMKFSPKHAIPLSNITVFGGALANTFLNAQKRHPLADRPMVDWDLILVMEPLTIAGALMGAFLNKLLPERLLVFLLVLLLSFTAYNTLKKAVKMYKIESRKLREQGYKADGTKESELTVISSRDQKEQTVEAGDELLKHMDLQEGEVPGDGDEDDAEASNLKTDPRVQQELQQILDEERVTPQGNIITLVAMFVVVLLINIMKGGGAFPSPLGIQCGSTAFWVANFLMLAWIVVISLFVRAYLVRRWETKERVGYKYVEGDIQWTARATIVYPVVCCAAGFFAGMFGVGKLLSDWTFSLFHDYFDPFLTYSHTL